MKTNYRPVAKPFPTELRNRRRNRFHRLKSLKEFVCVLKPHNSIVDTGVKYNHLFGAILVRANDFDGRPAIRIQQFNRP